MGLRGRAPAPGWGPASASPPWDSPLVFRKFPTHPLPWPLPPNSKIPLGVTGRYGLRKGFINRLWIPCKKKKKKSVAKNSSQHLREEKKRKLQQNSTGAVTFLPLVFRVSYSTGDGTERGEGGWGLSRTAIRNSIFGERRSPLPDCWPLDPFLVPAARLNWRQQQGAPVELGRWQRGPAGRACRVPKDARSGAAIGRLRIRG